MTAVEQGFTLLEAMVTLGIVALLLFIAVPSFNAVRLSATLTEVTNELVASVQLARSESIKRNGVARLCASTDGATCSTTSGFSNGWVVLDAANNVLLSRPAVDSSYRVTASGGLKLLVFYPSGMGATTASFTICRHQPLGQQQRVLAVGPTGGTRITRTEASSC
ncbi:MAG: GspH/FimT family pseudopilin [Steroidobacteraceae bacterium]